MNKLKPDFYKYLEVVIYNGPPQTIYEKYRGYVGNESGIIDALEKCSCAFGLYENIENPSENVTIAYLKRNWFLGFHKIKNPTKKIIYEKLIYDGCIDDVNHLDQFSQDEIIDILKLKPIVLRMIKNPTSSMIQTVIENNPGNIVFIKPEFQTPEMCKKSIFQAKVQNYNNFLDYIRYIPDQETANFIFTLPFLSKEVIKNLSDEDLVNLSHTNRSLHDLLFPIIQKRRSDYIKTIKELRKVILNRGIIYLGNLSPAIANKFPMSEIYYFDSEESKYIIDKENQVLETLSFSELKSIIFAQKDQIQFNEKMDRLTMNL